jgi:hypothetical protein
MLKIIQVRRTNVVSSLVVGLLLIAVLLTITIIVIPGKLSEDVRKALPAEAKVIEVDIATQAEASTGRPPPNCYDQFGSQLGKNQFLDKVSPNQTYFFKVNQHMIAVFPKEIKIIRVMQEFTPRYVVYKFDKVSFLAAWNRYGGPPYAHGRLSITLNELGNSVPPTFFDSESEAIQAIGFPAKPC